MANIIKGDELMLFIDGKSVAFAKSHVLTLTGNSVDISSKDHGGWGASAVGNITWEITSENLYTAAGYSALFDAMVAKDPIDVVFGVASDYNPDGLGSKENWTAPSDSGYSGQVVITSLVANANTGENATFSCTLTGVGALTANA